MNENNIAETAIAEQTSAGEEIAKAEETTPEKKSRKGLRALLIILIVILVLGVGTGAFLLGRNTDFDLSDVFSSMQTKNEAPTEPPEFLGMWSDDDHSFCISAGGIIEIDGVSYTYTWDDRTITIKTEDGEEHAIRYRKTSNTIKFWLEENKDDSVSLRIDTRNDPEDLYGTWYLGDAVLIFREDGTAEIYGNEYIFTADSFEITCKSDAGTEYMFYSVDGDFLTLRLPGDPTRPLRFISKNSIIPVVTGVWVEEKGADYILFFDDGSVSFGFFGGASLEDYLYALSDDYSISVEGNALVLYLDGLKIRCNMTVSGNAMDIEIFGDNYVYYKVSDDPRISHEEIELLWDMFSPTSAA